MVVDRQDIGILQAVSEHWQYDREKKHFHFTDLENLAKMYTREYMKMHTLGLRIVALVFAVALVGSGMVFADPPSPTPPSPPPGGPKELVDLTNGNANAGAVTKTAEVSPVFGASPKFR